MFVKSHNQMALINYFFLDETNVLAKVYCLKNRQLEFIKELQLIANIGGDRIAISDNAEYIISAVYEKKFYVYCKRDGYSITSYSTSKYIDSVDVVNEKIYIGFSDESIGIYNMSGEKIEEVHLKYFQNDVCGNQYLIESTYVNIARKRIRPLNSMIFNELILVKNKLFVNEKNRRLACYDLKGNLKWEYTRCEPELLFVGCVYSECVNKIILEVKVKKDTKNSYLYLIDVDEGSCVLEKKLNCLGIEFMDRNSVIIKSDMTVIDIEELIND